MTQVATPHASRRAADHGFATQAARWRALRERDRAADGAFVYAVKTTGVFCRPGCPSRRPLQRHVEYFTHAWQARRAGYRACKRCRPELATRHAWAASAPAIARACRLLERETPTQSREVAAALGWSTGYFTRAFKRALGVSPQAYRRRALAERSKRVLPRASSVTAALHDAGYGSSSRFYASAASELGMTPSDRRRGAAGQRVCYALEPCSLGILWVAWTARGVCDVGFADHADGADRALRERFPQADRTRARGEAARWVSAVVAAVEHPRSLALPLDVQGTAFQQRVWQVLRAIPVGETRSYGQIARALGSPRLARAVARACAQNRLAILVPCHRVVGRDGSICGYRWDPARKRSLLARERDASRRRGN